MACGVGVVSSAADSPNGISYGAAIGCPLKQLQHPVRHTQPPTQTASTPRPTHTAAHPNRFKIPSDTHSRPPKPLQLSIRHTQPPTQTASTPRPTHTAVHPNRFNSPFDTHRHRLKLLNARTLHPKLPTQTASSSYQVYTDTLKNRFKCAPNLTAPDIKHLACIFHKSLPIRDRVFLFYSAMMHNQVLEPV